MRLLFFTILLTLLFLFLIPFVAAEKVIISEIHAPGTFDEYVELYVQEDDGQSIDIGDWYLTTFDDEEHPNGGRNPGQVLHHFLRTGRIPWAKKLPTITNLHRFSYVAVHSGVGVNDLDASDGTAAIYLNRRRPILNSADEIALFDADRVVRDFVRYNGGNTNIALANWSPDDSIPAPTPQETLQIHGSDLDASSNWVSAPETRGQENVYAFTMHATGRTPPSSVNVRIQNGLSQPLAMEDRPGFPAPRGINITVFNASPTVNQTEIAIISGMLNHSYNFYRNAGFNEPQVGVDGIMNVTVTKNNQFSASTQPNGDIIVDIGGELTNRTVALVVKWTIEHEFLHTIQFGRYLLNGTYNESGPFNHDGRTWDGFAWRNAFIMDGPAEYWALQIAKAMFNATEEEIFNATLSVQRNYPGTFQSIPYNLSDILSRSFDFNLPFETTGSSSRMYQLGYLYCAYIAANYGEVKLQHIHNVTRANLSAASDRDVLDGAAVDLAFSQQGIAQTFNGTMADFVAWLYQTYGNQMGMTSVRSYNSSTPPFVRNTLVPWGSDLHTFVLFNGSNANVSAVHNVSFNGVLGQPYRVSIIGVDASGSRVIIIQQNINGSGTINFTGNFKNVTLITTRIDGVNASRNYNFTYELQGVANASIENSSSIDSRLSNVSLHNASLADRSTISDSAVANASRKIRSVVVSSRNSNCSISRSTEINTSCTDGLFIDSNLNESRLEKSSGISVNFSNVNATNGKLLVLTARNSSFNASELFNSTFINVTIDSSYSANSNVNHSRIANASVDKSTVGASTLNNSAVNQSRITDSTIDGSRISNSTLINCTVINSTITNSVKKNAVIINSVDLNSRVENAVEESSVVNQSVVGNATIRNVTMHNSSLHGAIPFLENFTIIDDVFVAGLRELPDFGNLSNQTNGTPINGTPGNGSVNGSGNDSSFILPGTDVFSGTANFFFIDQFPVTIPPNFFGPGSQPFSGQIILDGGLQLQRADAVELVPDVPAVVPFTPSFNFASVIPIDILFDDAHVEAFSVQVQPIGAPAAGTLDIIHASPNGGTFDATFHVTPLFTFTRLNDSAVLQLDAGAQNEQLQFQLIDAPWEFCPAYVAADSNFCPGMVGGAAVPLDWSGEQARLDYLNRNGIDPLSPEADRIRAYHLSTLLGGVVAAPGQPAENQSEVFRDVVVVE